MQVQQLDWGSMNNQKVSQFVLVNKNQMTAKIINYGAILVSLEMPDRNGKTDNILLGYSNLAGYQNDSFFIGATVGRYANRIARGRFTLDGKECHLPINDGPNHLHGGPDGFYKKVWEAKPFQEADRGGVVLTYFSQDGEAGYPGNLNVKVTYCLTDHNELKIDYEATTDRATPVNLTNHAYWNLAGKNTIKNHVLTLFASRYLPVDETAIPLGELAPVQGTPMDFTVAKSIGQDLDSIPGGYDHCYAVDSPSDRAVPAARLEDPDSGRIMNVLTTKPGIQFYSGNFLEDPFLKHGACCLETQYFPDSPNQPDFPSCILLPEDVYQHATIHRFDIE
ncbi:galactose mutarotase [bacterium]|nr:galactose mutarotase [bacterium]